MRRQSGNSLWRRGRQKPSPANGRFRLWVTQSAASLDQRVDNVCKLFRRSLSGTNPKDSTSRIVLGWTGMCFRWWTSNRVESRDWLPVSALSMIHVEIHLDGQVEDTQTCRLCVNVRFSYIQLCIFYNKMERNVVPVHFCDDYFTLALLHKFRRK